MNYLVYLAYGSADICSEAFYSIISYYHVVAGQPATILIYTDNKEEFQQVFGPRPELVYPNITAEQWRIWHGHVNKVYLLKIGVLEHAAAHYPGNLLFLDTDTIWQHDPTPVFAGIAMGKRYMHLNEGALAEGNALSRKVYQHLKAYTWQIGDNRFQVKANTLLYNSGVIGFQSKGASLLPEVAQLAEQLYATYNKHMMEQLAFSLRFVVDGAIEEAAPFLVHYWNLKEVRPTLTQLFAKYKGQSLEELYARASALHLPMLHKEEMNYRSLPGWRRTLLKLAGQRWKMPVLEV